jgi:hypothetical protein
MRALKGARVLFFLLITNETDCLRDLVTIFAVHHIVHTGKQKLMQSQNIKDLTSFQDWLDAWPEVSRPKTAVALAHRAAMRALPFIKFDQGTFNFENVFLVVFGCSFATRVSLTLPNIPEDLHFFLNESLFEATAAIGDANSRSKDQAMASADARMFAYALEELLGPRFKGGAIVALTHAANAFESTLGDSTVHWNAVRSDAGILETKMSIQSLLDSRLWFIETAVGQVEISLFHHHLQSGQMLGDGWNVWAQWYSCILLGTPIFDIQAPSVRQTLERNIALGSTDGIFNKGFWTREPKLINTDIGNWVNAAQKADELHHAMDAGPGTSWRTTANGYELNYSGDVTDAEVSASEETAFEHELLKKSLAKLIAKSAKISSREQWEEFGESCEWLNEAINCESASLHENILKIYHASLKLTTFLDQKNKLSARRGANFGHPLLVDESRLLLETTAIVSPWIGRFPTAKRKDLEAGQAFRLLAEEAVAAHVRIANTAQEFGLISETDRRLLVSLVEFLQKNQSLQGVPAEKLQAHGTWTVKNLVFAVALGVTGNLMSDVFQETKTWQQSRDFLVRNVKLVEEVIADAPANVQAIVKSIIEDQQDHDPQPTGSVKAAAIENRKRRLSGKRRTIE